MCVDVCFGLQSETCTKLSKSVLGNTKWDILEDSLNLSRRGSFWILSWKESDALRDKFKFSL